MLCVCARGTREERRERDVANSDGVTVSLEFGNVIAQLADSLASFKLDD